jgi:hypothetical protein
MATDASAMSAGTILSKASDGVSRSSAAPATPPSTPAGTCRSSRRRWPVSSGRLALTEPTDNSDMDTVLVMFAVTGGTPVSSSAG